jgi:hypothetical protein
MKVTSGYFSAARLMAPTSWAAAWAFASFEVWVRGTTMERDGNAT